MNNPSINNNTPGFSLTPSLSPLAPAGAPSGVSQTPSPNPIPVDVQSLVNLKPKERVRAVMKMSVASPQDEDALAILAQNKQWDGKLRLAAAIKLKDSQKRDKLLAELAQDSSLDGDVRLRAAEKISSLEQKKSTLAALAGDPSLKEEHQLEAQISIHFILEAQATSTMHKADLAEIKLALEQTKGDILSSLEQVQKFSLDVAPGASSVPAQKKAELSFDQEQKLNLEMTFKTASSSIKEDVLAFFAYDPSWTNDNRLEAALKMARIEEDSSSGYAGSDSHAVLWMLMGDPSLSSQHRLEALVKMQKIHADYGCKGEIDKYLGVFVQDKALDKEDPSKSYRLEAALHIDSTEQRDYFLASLAKDTSLIHYYRLKAVTHIGDQKIKNDLWVTLAQDPSFTNSHRLQAAFSIEYEPDCRDDLLASIAQDSAFSIYHRMSSAIGMRPGLRKDNILAALSQIPTMDGYQHLEVISRMRPGDRRDDLMAEAVQDSTVNVSYRIDGGISHMSESKRRDDLLLTFAKDASLNIYERRQAVDLMREGQLKNDLLAELT